jgi:hypothetical protein
VEIIKIGMYDRYFFSVINNYGQAFGAILVADNAGLPDGLVRTIENFNLHTTENPAFVTYEPSMARASPMIF